MIIGDVRVYVNPAQGYERQFTGGAAYIVEKDGQPCRAGVEAFNTLCAALLAAGDEEAK